MEEGGAHERPAGRTKPHRASSTAIPQGSEDGAGRKRREPAGPSRPAALKRANIPSGRADRNRPEGDLRLRAKARPAGPPPVLIAPSADAIRWPSAIRNWAGNAERSVDGPDRGAGILGLRPSVAFSVGAGLTRPGPHRGRRIALTEAAQVRRSGRAHHLRLEGVYTHPGKVAK